ncbi:glycoside hydrolase family 2 protein [Ferdinandcohnia quinoae]|uniref:Beta-galactosidase n=1 Tax=Fredinandcohnia quinoae TaxID=2918902 RepID=A0AAW5E4V8_9BACI|nr:sugar-binding domain-containing protein [Fredinandcohnia sp. SECRCQ15]MCH1624123.1 hypothetical protein [Fredinandcohnia sp. SECRCQ15]
MISKNKMEWKPVEGGLMTRWAKEVKPASALPEYPRPQMVRENWLNLNGLWEYAIREEAVNEVQEYDGEILVPFPVESSLSGVKKPLKPNEKLWYRKTFQIPNEWKNQKLLLHFGAVDWKAEVWINKHKVGEHTGGYYPFSFEITEYSIECENEIIISVWDPTDSNGHERGKQTLHPKGLFYTAVSGIWQTIWIEPVPKQYIKSIRMTPNIDESELLLHVEIEGKIHNLEIEAIVFEDGNKLVIEKGSHTDNINLKIPNPKFWSPDTPYLYDIAVQLVGNGLIIDEVKSYFGMRKFSVERDSAGVKRLFLNNNPLFQNGILDQGYWPDGLYTAPTDEALKFDVEIAKKLGFNMIRKHIKVEPARWYYHCDRLGIIVWQDMINGGGGWNHLHHFILPNLFRSLKVKDDKYKALGRVQKENRDNFKKELKEMIDALYNVPSIGMWVPFNEAWGQFDAAEIADWVRNYDPSRCVDHASGWHDQRIGDIKSIHIYFRKLTMPRHINDRSVVISEYGGYSYHEKDHVWDEERSFGYRKFKTKPTLFAAYKSLIDYQLKPLIYQGVSAAVYTQLTDVEEEVNGLLTYDREIIKMDVDLMNDLNQSCIDSKINSLPSFEK